MKEGNYPDLSLSTATYVANTNNTPGLENFITGGALTGQTTDWNPQGFSYDSAVIHLVSAVDNLIRQQAQDHTSLATCARAAELIMQRFNASNPGLSRAWENVENDFNTVNTRLGEEIQAFFTAVKNFANRTEENENDMITVAQNTQSASEKLIGALRKK